MDPAGLLLLSSKQDSGEFIDKKLDFMGLSERSGSPFFVLKWMRGEAERGKGGDIHSIKMEWGREYLSHL